MLGSIYHICHRVLNMSKELNKSGMFIAGEYNETWRAAQEEVEVSGANIKGGRPGFI